MRKDHKASIIYLILGFVLTVFLTAYPKTAHANPASEALVAEGRSLLFSNMNSTEPTFSGLLAANNKFKAALQADATDPQANLFYALTRFVPFILEQEGGSGYETLMDLAEAVLALHVMAGINPSSPVSKAAGVDGDGKIGMAEVIYIIQYLAELR